ncbi:unnamed protein product [Gordionus sp. m RMFG-2023]|uniref:small ribosomal subunit protein mS40-like n=1 Tax=Gordionus sp. m RMFG-2023 TaxID=3053472 RepID=UPI0030DE1E49
MNKISFFHDAFYNFYKVNKIINHAQISPVRCNQFYCFISSSLKNYAIDVKTKITEYGKEKSINDPPDSYSEEYDQYGFRIIKSKKTIVRLLPLEESMRYLLSEAYKTTYGLDPVWKNYRRNHKYQRPPITPRKKCIRDSVIISASPCPICRDQYLVLDYKNVHLLSQFICPYSNEILSTKITGLCQEKDFKLRVEIAKAFDYGFIELKLPYIKYNYQDYFPKHFGKNYEKSSAI